MLYNGLYSGPKTDELLESIMHIKSVVNGWVNLESTSESPIDLSTLINPGNFSTFYWSDGPTDGIFQSPLKVIVTKEESLIRQYVFSYGYNVDGYTRTFDTNTITMNAWKSIHLNTGIFAMDTAPTNPKKNDIWINTSNTGAIIQYYDITLNDWASLNPYDYMDVSIYNPNKVSFKDVFKYIDEKVKNISGGSSPVDFSAHIQNISIHLTQDEKIYYETKLTDNGLLDIMQSIAEWLNQYIANEASSTGQAIPQIEQLIQSALMELNTHKDDTSIHPTVAQINDWNSKSDVEHSHSVDQIQLDTTDVIGTLSIDNIPDDAKERMIEVASEEELLALTVNDVQNGDFVYIHYPDTVAEIVIVVDQSKLGTKDAFISYHAPGEEALWEEVKYKPTTIEELGITDMSPNAQVDEYLATAEDECSKTQELIDAMSAINVYSDNNHITSVHEIESSIDSTDYKLNTLNKLITLPENIIRKLEDIIQ